MKKIQSIFLLFAILIASQFASAQYQNKQRFNVQEMISKNKTKILQAIADKKAGAISQRNFSIDTFTNLPADARVPGQFEETQAVIITWAFNYIFDTINNTLTYTTPGDETNPDAFISMRLAHAIQQNAKVLIRVPHFSDTTAIKSIMSNYGTPLVNYSFYECTINSWWDRDSGPISFYYSNNDSIGMIDMDYYTLAGLEDTSGFVLNDFDVLNTGGRINDDSIPVKVGQFFNYPVFKTPLNNEGGNLIFNGISDVWTSTRTRESNVGYSYPLIFGTNGFPLIDSNGQYLRDSSLKIYANYPPLDDSAYKNLHLKSFNCKKLVEPETFVCDGGTGHLDIYSKLFDEHNLGIVDYAQAVNHTDYNAWNANLQMLQSATDAYGKPYTLHIIPMPPTSLGTTQTDCEQDQRTYINGIFVNKTLIMPINSNPLNMTIKDAQGIEASKKAFPGYNIYPIDASSMYGYGGALHCITMQIPAENPIYIKHDAYSGNVPYSNSYAINTFIKNKSGIANAKVYFRKASTTVWSNAILNIGTNNNYASAIPSAGFGNGDTIEYFIEAVSNNGKTISKPFTAREGGAHRFVIAGAPTSITPIANTTNFVMSAYPNPSNGQFTIPVSIDNARKIEITITDITGKLVFSNQQNLLKGLHLLQLSKQDFNVQSGLYILSISIDGVANNIQKIKIQ
jgi:agmatine/peptidylarginine deiminase